MGKDRDLEKGLLEEGTMRNMINKYEAKKIIESCNEYVQNIVMPELKILPQIHILDCTKIEVNLNNSNYENSEVIRYEGKSTHGYKLATLRTNKKVNTYIPAKKNMIIYEQAVSIAKSEDKWHPHSNKKRNTQEIQLVKDLGSSWISENLEEDYILSII